MKTDAARLPAEAYAALDSVQIANLVKSAPGVAEALKAANYSPMPSEGEAITSFLPKMVDGMKAVDGRRGCAEEGRTSRGTSSGRPS